MHKCNNYYFIIIFSLLVLKFVSLISFYNQAQMNTLPRAEMEQMKEQKDNEIRNITEKYETAVMKLKTELSDGSKQIQNLRAEKVNVYLCITLPSVYKYLLNAK